MGLLRAMEAYLGLHGVTWAYLGLSKLMKGFLGFPHL